MSINREKNRIYINLNKCTGCRSCEIACSYHFSKTFNPEISSISVIRNDRTGDIKISINSTCDFCKDEDKPLCMKYCVSQALSII
ncbi:4Fe-4S binding protein [Candidatus Aerophobetes bacterium]|nr:4Fe-4S binding protein [Candidatus Aerophobetes bacterium]